MKKCLALLISVLLFGSSYAAAQPSLVASSGGYQMTTDHLVPTVALLNFLSQQELNEQEIVYLAQHAAAEFQKDPRAFVQSAEQLGQYLNKLQKMDNVGELGRVRAAALGEIASQVHNRPYNEWPATHQILFQKAPVVAYDPNTGIVLTKPDLMAAITVMQEATGQTLFSTQQDVQEIVKEFGQRFSELSESQQYTMANGTLLLDLYRNSPQPSNFSNHNQGFHTHNSTGGPPAGNSDAARHRALDQQAMNMLYHNMNQSHVRMLNGFEGMTGSGIEWTYGPSW